MTREPRPTEKRQLAGKAFRKRSSENSRRSAVAVKSACRRASRIARLSAISTAPHKLKTNRPTSPAPERRTMAGRKGEELRRVEAI